MFDTGSAGFMLVSTMLVFLMTPGIAFFYGGLSRRKNVVNTMIMGAKAMAGADSQAAEQIRQTLPEKYHIRPDEIAAYRLLASNNCYCQSVINPKTGLISKNELDRASDTIMQTFNTLYMHYAKTRKR